MFKQPRHLFEFGRFRLDRTERFLFQDGAAVPLSPRLFDTLLVLVENRGHVVEKNDLMQKVWNDVAVEENNLTQSISALRKILGDNLDGSEIHRDHPKARLSLCRSGQGGLGGRTRKRPALCHQFERQRTPRNRAPRRREYRKNVHYASLQQSCLEPYSWCWSERS